MKSTNLSGVVKGAVAFGVLAALSTGSWAQIKGSKHDLGQGGSAQATTTVTTEVCVFCHTPHGSDTTAAAPLWNKAVTTPGSYQRYSNLNNSTLDGREAPVGSVSLACLSCHDGTQAMDVVINAPGSGGYNAAGAELDPTAIGVMEGTPIPALGTDLQNDHPISIQYAGGACQGTSADCDPSTAATGDRDFRVAQFQNINNQPQWWVDTTTAAGGVADRRDKTDMILYSRSDFTGGTGTGPSVECGSCHDPHEAAERPVSFMRISNNNSDVCLACHIK